MSAFTGARSLDAHAAVAPRRVLLVDDHQLVREGLKLVIGHSNDLAVCADVADPAVARQVLADLQPDVAVVDLSLQPGGTEGLDLVRWISQHHPRTRCVVSSMHEEWLYGERALRAGAMGYVSKSAPAETVLEAIRAVCEGQPYFSATLLRAMRARSMPNAPREPTSPMDRLSERELQVFRRIGEGFTSKEIAAELGVSVSTVDTYRDRLKSKFGISSGAALLHRATRWAIENL